jgi:protein-disulfide isomerase
MTDQELNEPKLDLLPLREEDHIRGGRDAEITLVEFGDYECPACAEAAPVITRLEAELGDSLRYVFRHFPFAGIHPHAELAAQAAEAAGAQDRFWEMHNSLFDRSRGLEWNDLVARAEELHLDTEAFEDDLKSEKFLDRVRSDFRTGVQNGVFTTPGFFINGIRHNGDADYETLNEALHRELESLQSR